MPGLFPRTLDLKMGWGDVDSCVDIKGNDVIQALADQPLFDLTGRGGGSSPQFASVDSGIYAWATGTDAALQNSELWIKADDDHGGEVMADSGGLVCATQDANRCVGPCNLVRRLPAARDRPHTRQLLPADPTTPPPRPRRSLPAWWVASRW